jgi:hypothetical protein
MRMNSGRTDAATGRPPTPDRPLRLQGHSGGWLAVAEWGRGFCARHICLPIWRHIAAADVDWVAKVVTCQPTSPPVTTRHTRDKLGPSGGL